MKRIKDEIKAMEKIGTDVDLIVKKAEDYLYSSVRNYAELNSFLDVFVLDHKLLIQNWK